MPPRKRCLARGSPAENPPSAFRPGWLADFPPICPLARSVLLGGRYSGMSSKILWDHKVTGDLAVAEPGGKCVLLVRMKAKVTPQKVLETPEIYRYLDYRVYL